MTPGVGILGTGLDVVDVEAFAAQLNEPGTSFARVFTARERREARSRAAAHAPGGAGSGRCDPGSDGAVPCREAPGPADANGVAAPGGRPDPRAAGSARACAGQPATSGRVGAAVGLEEARHLAARWAAKEAFVKAWSAALHGSPPVMGHVAWHEIEIVSDPWHRPAIALHGEAARAFAESAKENKKRHKCCDGRRPGDRRGGLGPRGPDGSAFVRWRALWLKRVILLIGKPLL